jgi:MFS family permease
MTWTRRLTPFTGLVGIALLVAGLGLDAAPTSSWPDAQIEAWYSDHGNGRWLLSAYLIAAAAPLLVAFSADVRQRLSRSGAGERAQSMVLGSGIAFAVTVLTGAGLYAAVPAARTFAGAPAPTADVSRYLLGASYGTLVMFSALAAALFAGTLSVVSLRGDVLPRWLAVAGLPATVLMLLNAVLPMAVITIWFVTVSVTLAVRRPVLEPQTGRGMSMPTGRSASGQPSSSTAVRNA